jgi:hypothetical protein
VTLDFLCRRGDAYAASRIDGFLDASLMFAPRRTRYRRVQDAMAVIFAKFSKLAAVRQMLLWFLDTGWSRAAGSASSFARSGRGRCRTAALSVGQAHARR